MAHKNFLVCFVLVGFFSQACVSRRPVMAPVAKTTPDNSASSANKVDTAPKVDGVPSADPTTEASVSDVPSLVPGLDKNVQFGVWIDSVGVDAFAALGFLQELERQGYRPAKVAGTGLGCWIAYSWALENNGNRAEWQAFKLDHLNDLQASWVARMGAGTKKSADFQDRLDRVLPEKRFIGLNLPLDCPLLENQNPYRLVSARSWSVSEALWWQLQLPTLVGAKISPSARFFSGAFGIGLTPSEISDFSHEFKSGIYSESFKGWLVLRTRKPADYGWGADDSLVRGLFQRAERLTGGSYEGPDARQSVVVSLVPASVEPGFQDVTRMDQRRRWMLWGRDSARKQLSDGTSMKKFLAPSSR